MDNYKNKYIKYKYKYLINKSHNIENICKEITFIRHGESTANMAREKGIEYDIENVVLTDKGIEQAKKTGEYLLENYGKFDKIYSSPATRCIQTSNIIMEKISHPIEELIIDDLVVEAGFFNYNTRGMNKDLADEFLKKNKKLILLKEKIAETKNPFDRIELLKKYNKESEIYFETKPTLQEVYDNYTLFLDKIKNLPESDKKILVIGHYGTLENMIKLVCNIDVDNTPIIGPIEVKPNSEEIESLKSKIYGNCSIMSMCYCKNKFQIISSPNTYHLD